MQNEEDSLLSAWQKHCGNKDSDYPCENFKSGWNAARNKRKQSQLHPLVEKILGDVARLPFIKGNSSMEGWYIWRLNKDWPVHEYKVLEVTDGIMSDSEPGDVEYGAWRVCEDKLWGEFFGPILER